MISHAMIKIQAVRSANAKDLSDINRLLRQLSASSRKLDMRSYRRLLAEKNLVLLGVRDDGRLIGMGSLVLMETPTALRSRMEDVVVDEKYRGQGIGTQVIHALIALAKKKGAASMDFTSSAEREAAHKLYERLGFQKRDTAVYRLNMIDRFAYKKK
jgi:ribosomal protein S18 acetylase RimI-like enzyme